jgi:hypothetical protein
MTVKLRHGAFVEYADIVHEMDSSYGGPHYSDGTQPKGRKMLFHIFTYLSIHRRSTCEEIALDEIKNNPKSKRKTKSVTDDIRKFILNNLLPRKLVKEEGIKTKHSKKIQSYSLDYNGVLYAIHLLSKNTPHAEFHNLIIYDERIIRNLAVEYDEYLPFVFDRLGVFGSILGKEWLHYLKIHEIADKGLNAISGPNFNPSSYDFLNDFIVRSVFVLLTSTSPDDVDMSKLSDGEKQHIFKLHSEGKLSSIENFDSLYAWYNHKQKPNTWTNIPHYLKKVRDPWGIAITLIIYNNMIGQLSDEWLKRIPELYDDSEHVRKNIVKKSKELFREEPSFGYWYWQFVTAAVSNMNKIARNMKEFEKSVGFLLT